VSTNEYWTYVFFFWVLAADLGKPGTKMETELVPQICITSSTICITKLLNQAHFCLCILEQLHAKEVLRSLTIEKDGVDGSKIYL
jgi:hypothetical protein